MPAAVPLDTALQLERRILVLDGAMGSMALSYGLDEAGFKGERFAHHAAPLRGNCDALTLSQPEIVSSIHDSYLRAGADIVTTNTFNATRTSQAAYHLQDVVYELNFAAAQLARAAADAHTQRSSLKPRFVAGAMGPTSVRLSRQPNAPESLFQELCDDYAEQARGLIAGGVDLLLLETVVDQATLRAARFGIAEAFDQTGRSMPLMISFVLDDRTGNPLCGETIAAICGSVAEAQPFALAINCSRTSPHLLRAITELSCRASTTFVGCYPSAGLPGASGSYKQTPLELATFLAEASSDGLLNIVGGCCGTTPEHIHEIASHVAGAAPRRPTSFAPKS